MSDLGYVYGDIGRNNIQSLPLVSTGEMASKLLCLAAANPVGPPSDVSHCRLLLIDSSLGTGSDQTEGADTEIGNTVVPLADTDDGNSPVSPSNIPESSQPTGEPVTAIEQIRKINLDGTQLAILMRPLDSRSAFPNEIIQALVDAGAQAVLYSVLPSQPSEVHAFVKSYVKFLRKGASVTSALVSTERLLSRSPATAWGGFAVAGDGTVTPWPHH